MTEHTQYSPLILGANEDGMALHRIHDGGGKNPFDIGGICACGLGVAIEVKIVHDKIPTTDEPVHWGRFESQQITWLRKYAQKGALAFAAVYYSEPRAMHVTKVGYKSDCVLPIFVDKCILYQNTGMYHGLRQLCPICSFVNE